MGSWYSCLQTSCHCFHSVKNVFIWNNLIREASSWGDDLRSRSLPFAEILNTRGQKLFFRSTPSACAVFFSWGCVETKWLATIYSSFLITLDYRPCISIVHGRTVRTSPGKFKTCAAEHSNRFGAASMRNSSSFRACWAGLGKGSYLEQALSFCSRSFIQVQIYKWIKVYFSIARDACGQSL